MTYLNIKFLGWPQLYAVPTLSKNKDPLFILYKK